jgi:hypothetical protein
MKVILAILTLGLIGNSLCMAELVKTKGKGEIVYQGLFQEGSLEERTAIASAKQNALTRYAASMDPARYELYKRVEQEVLAHIDDYITDYVVIDKQIDKDSRRFSIVIEGSLNTTLLESTIQRSSAAAAPGAGEQSNLTFIFVARELEARKIFDAKRTNVSINEGSQAVSEKDAVAPEGQSTQSAMNSSSVSKTTAGGNTEIKADALTYRVATVAEVDSAVNAVLTNAHYETVDPNDAGLDVEKFKADFSSGNDISAATRAEAIAILRKNDVRYMAIASMDVGLPESDPVSGLIRVFVTVNAKVTYLPPVPAEGQPRRLPKTVASIAGKPYAGLGPNPQVARTNALNEAATKSAQELTDQLRMKNIR